MFGLRGTELLLILLVLLLLFGATRLPQLGSSLGSAIRNFKKGFGGDAEPAEEEKKGGTLSAAAGTEAKTTTKEPTKAREG
jgi:sec-independent protein translocase protein TatA